MFNDSSLQSLRRARRGMSIIVVLAMISIAMAMSYAVLRSQGTMVAIGQNNNSQGQARQAAIAGMSLALRKMHQSDWAGVGTTLAGNLSTTESYSVTYTTGDPALDSGHADYSDWPYRVTLLSTGTSTVPGGTSTATHRIRAVVKLVPRQLADEPAKWSEMQNYTVYQWLNETFEISSPVHVEGPVSAEGEILLCEDYPANSSNAFDGLIDEVAIFDSAISESTIEDIANEAVSLQKLAEYYANEDPIAWWRLDEAAGATVAADVEGANDGIYESAESGQAGLAFDGTNLAARFDGLDDGIDCGNLDVPSGTDELTILAWFKADNLDDSAGRFVSKASSGSSTFHTWSVSTIDVLGFKRLRFMLQAGGSTAKLSATWGSISPGQWYFVAAVYDGSKMKLYLDGALVGQLSKSGNIDVDPDARVYIGSSPPGDSKRRYLRDLEAMRVASVGDYRPFSGPLTTPRSRTSDTTLDLLENELGVIVNDAATDGTEPLTHPGTVATYQLYPGGQVYNVETINTTSLTSVTLGPSPETNPLGIFYKYGRVDLYDNVTIQGTLITNYSTSWMADINFYGSNNHLLPVDMPALDGTSEPIQLPVTMAWDDVNTSSGSGNSLRGLVTAQNHFRFTGTDDDLECDVQGRILAGKLKLFGRDNWINDASWWWDRLGEFYAQLNDGSPVDYFPTWLSNEHGMYDEPKLTIEPDPVAVRYHWPDFSQTIFVAHPDDEGLRWDLLSWEDGI